MREIHVEVLKELKNDKSWDFTMCTCYRLDKENETQIEGHDMFVQKENPLKRLISSFKTVQYIMLKWNLLLSILIW